MNGQDRAEYDKQFALEQMGLLMYEMAVLDLFPVGEKMIRDARRRLYEAREQNVTIADYWSVTRMGDV